MSPCKFGVTIDAPLGPHAFTLARRAEEWGFDGLWARDHVSFTQSLPDPLTLLTGFAAVTSRVTIGTGIYLFPLRHPTLVAKMVATADYLSAGRFMFGIGVGGEFPQEWEGCGIPVKERGSRCNEGLEVVRRLWSEEHVAHRGKHFSFSDVNIDPKPARPGGPPILIGGRGEVSFRRAARYGHGWIPYLLDPPRLREGLATIRRFAEEEGRGEMPFLLSPLIYLRLDRDYETALRWTANHLGARYNQPFEKPVRRYALLGTPAQVIEQIGPYLEAGVTHIIFEPMTDPEGYGDLLQAIAEEVLPKVRGRAA